MKRLFSLIFCLTIPFNSLAYSQQDRQLIQERPAPSSNRRIALVMGNGAYLNAPALKNPPNDASDMADALTSLGFSVDRGVNLTQREMKAKIRQFGQTLRGGGQGLFYFAGHGIQIRGRNFLIPVDANIQSETDVEDQGVDANLVLGLMDEAGNGLNVVVLDACRNNPFARSFRSASNGLAQMDAPSGTIIAYATAPGSVASDGNGRNGLYTQELLRFMRTAGLDVENVFKQVRISVRNQTSGKQTPWESSSLTGDFYFNGAKAEVNSTSSMPPAAVRPSSPTSQPTQKAISNLEGTMWDVTSYFPTGEGRSKFEFLAGGVMRSTNLYRNTITTFAWREEGTRVIIDLVKEDFTSQWIGTVSGQAIKGSGVSKNAKTNSTSEWTWAATKSN